MKKRLKFRKLQRNTAHRLAMLKNMATSLILHERLITTHPKACEVRRVGEKLIKQGKDGSLHSRRLAARTLKTPAAVTKLMEILGPRYADRQGGYTRVLKLAEPRRRDGAMMSVVELVDRPGEIRVARPARPMGMGTIGWGKEMLEILENNTEVDGINLDRLNLEEAGDILDSGDGGEGEETINKGKV